MSDSERKIKGVPYSEYNKAAAAKRYNRLKAAGVCPRCGGPRDVLNPTTGRSGLLCQVCRDGLRKSKELASEGVSS